MTRLNNDQIMDYLDGSLSLEETARVEAHLKTNADDADLVNMLRTSVALTHEVRDSEAALFTTSEKFWPTLRDKLGPAPKRSAWSSFQKSFSGLFATSPATRLSFGAIAVAIVIALGSLLVSPQHATVSSVASTTMTQQDKAFIQSSLVKHQAYVASQPVAGDVSSGETGADDDEEPTTP